MTIDFIKGAGCFNDIDIHIADFLADIGGTDSFEFYIAVMMLSHSLSRGDVCLSLADVAKKPLSYFFGKAALPVDISMPDKDELISALVKSRAVGRETDYLPLILDLGDRLYFQKYFSFEKRLTESIKGITERKCLPKNAENIKNIFSILFPQNGLEVDWQSAAAYSALGGGLTLISGGPGTGKTSTVVKILALLAETAADENKEITIALAAPTGKAAARLRESVNSAAVSLPVRDSIKKAIPSQTFTIHRLLGSIKGSHEFRHNKINPLPYDVIVVDECSMADVALMCRLFQSVKPDAQIILLGDKDQLSSVEGGAVFGDLCGGAEGAYSEEFFDYGRKTFGINFPKTGSSKQSELMENTLIVLKKSYRFGAESGIWRFSDLVKMGDADGAMEALHNEKFDDIKFVDKNSLRDIGNIYRSISQKIISGMNCSVEEKISAVINGFSILTATRMGEFGAERMNFIAEEVLFDLEIIDPADRFYKGRPVMILRNDYSLGLFNGDIGIVSSDGSGEVIFSDTGSGPRAVHYSRLPEHETAYAMTIHKSQGSEFDKVLVVLGERINMVMTRELLYTAVTRAKSGVVIAAAENIIREMILTPTKRVSGLISRLRESSS